MKMTKIRLWIEMLLAASAIACIVALFLATLGSAAGAADEDSKAEPPAQISTAQTQLYEGVITDTRCGAKHSAAVGLAAADCTRVCVHRGDSFALVDGEKTYTLQGQQAALKRVAGERVKIFGTLNGNTISVASVASAS
ncbi:MAG: hypothetical protein WBX08_02320 [Candidatus Sulfotelmatobacter sp.]